MNEDVLISGMKARLDGVECSIERLEEYRDDLQIQIAALQGQRANGNGGLEALHPGAALHIRQAAAREAMSKIQGGWPDDPAERKAEAARRAQVTAAKKRTAGQRRAAKKRWAKMTAKQRKEHLAKMQKGRKAAVAAAA